MIYHCVLLNNICAQKLYCEPRIRTLSEAKGAYVMADRYLTMMVLFINVIEKFLDVLHEDIV